MANSAMDRRREKRAEELNNLKAQYTDERSQNDENPLPADDTPADEDNGQITREQFERLKGKSSSIERENATLRKELETLKTDLNTIKNPPKSKADLEKEFEEELRKEVGEDNWDYMDDASKRAMIAVAKRAAKSEKPQNAIQDEIDKAFQSREDKAKSQEFISKLDGGLKERGRRLKFVTLINSDKFSAWMDKSRRNIAIFEDAMKYRDDEAVRDMLTVIDEYYRETEGRANPTTPAATSNKTKLNSQKSDVVTEEEYYQALKDKRHPSRRERARKIIALYKEQNNG